MEFGHLLFSPGGEKMSAFFIEPLVSNFQSPPSGVKKPSSPSAVMNASPPLLRRSRCFPARPSEQRVSRNIRVRLIFPSVSCLGNRDKPPLPLDH